jgi:hypothetical protein
VAREMKSKIWYIIVEDFTLQDIAKINSNTEKWKTEDYINCYVQQENDNYIQLREFLEKTNFPLSVSLHLLSRGVVGHDGGASSNESDDFKRGKFVVKYADNAWKLHQAVKQFEGFHQHTNRHFIVALDILLRSDKCDFVELIEQYKKEGVKLERRGSVKEYLVNLEEIYNYRMRQRRVIY